jgi:hypothetical protein
MREPRTYQQEGKHQQKGEKHKSKIGERFNIKNQACEIRRRYGSHVSSRKNPKD